MSILNGSSEELGKRGFLKDEVGMKGKRLKEMCHWMGSYFHDCVDYNGAAFSIQLLQWGCTFSGC